MIYNIRHIDLPHQEASPLTDEIWATAEVGKIDNVKKADFGEVPAVTFRVLYDNKGLYVKFDVKNDHVRCVKTHYQDGVCDDSCVEFFFRPAVNNGYANIEMNACGTMLAYHITDWRRIEGGFAGMEKFPPEADKELLRWTTFHGTVEPEPAEAKDWTNIEFIPFTLLKKMFGCEAPVKGEEWAANFYKCGDKTSRPHWITWNPIGVLNFHTPEYFGKLIFQ